MEFKLVKSRFECTVDVVGINKRGEDADIVEISARLYGEAPVMIDELCFRNKRHPDDPSARWIPRETAENFVGQKGIAAGIRNIRFQLKRKNSNIQEGKETPLYEPMKKIVDQYVQHFESDFTIHDCELLGKGANHFLWMVHDNGTWNYSEQCDWADEIIQNAEKDPNIIPFIVKDGMVTRLDSESLRMVYHAFPDNRSQVVLA